jgi:hypothetical protein
MVFALVVGAVVTMAYGCGISSDRILLGLMPFATCAAMVISALGHAMFRWTRPEEGNRVQCQEKIQLLL